MHHPSPPIRRRIAGYTLMEIVVVAAIILVLAVIVYPVYNVISARKNKGIALKVMRDLGAACRNFAGQNDGLLPPEDVPGPNTWLAAADPANAKIWYNSLPKLIGGKGVGDYAGDPASFYKKDNLLYLPGATYPTTSKRLVRPLFAIAINSKLQRRDPATGVKNDLRLSDITQPQRTVLFLEQGLKTEKKTLPVQSGYDGSCKGSARTFVGRYGGQGVLTFADGHADLVEVAETLTATGAFPFPATDIIWCRTPEENPN